MFSADYEKAIELCDESVEFTIFRDERSSNVPIYGSHIGKQAGIELFQNLSNLFDFGDFNVDESIITSHKGNGYIIRFGNLSHTVKSTGNVFNSLWVLIVRFNTEGKISLYRMYEDTAALEFAMNL